VPGQIRTGLSAPLVKLLLRAVDLAQGLEQLLPSGASRRDLDDWERTVDVYGVEIGGASPELMLQHLLIDLGEVRGLLDGRAPLPTHRRLLRVASSLSPKARST